MELRTVKEKKENGYFVQGRCLSLCKNSKDPPTTQGKEIALFPTETAEIEYPSNLGWEARPQPKINFREVQLCGIFCSPNDAFAENSYLLHMKSAPGEFVRICS